MRFAPPPFRWIAPLLCVLLAVGCGLGAPHPADISSFRPPSGTVGEGEPATAALRVTNTGTEQTTLWLSFEVRGDGVRRQAPSRPVFLDPDEESGTQRMTTGPLTAAGPYDATVSVWDGRPGEEGAERLASADREGAFAVGSPEPAGRDDFASLNGDRWSVSDKTLGRSRLRESNVGVVDGELRLELPAGAVEGGELASEERFVYGSFAARMKVARAPSSITGFFLYNAPDFHAEIDVEIYNDASRRVLFTTYANGEQTNTVKKRLPFDPTAGFHEYRIALYPTEARFYVDGELFQTFDEGLPADSMQLMVNAWYPTWLPGKSPPSDAFTAVDWIRT